MSNIRALMDTATAAVAAAGNSGFPETVAAAAAAAVDKKVAPLLPDSSCPAAA